MTIPEQAAIRAGCNAADAHLTCSYPECKCKQIPTAIKAALSHMGVQRREGWEAELIERCARVADVTADKVQDVNADRYWQSRRIAGAIRALSAAPASPRAEGEWRDVPAHEIAMALCAVDGHDPDTEAPITEMCDAANMPVPWWMVYVEYAEALLEKFKVHAPPVIADQQQPEAK